MLCLAEEKKKRKGSLSRIQQSGDNAASFVHAAWFLTWKKREPLKKQQAHRGEGPLFSSLLLDSIIITDPVGSG